MGQCRTCNLCEKRIRPSAKTLTAIDGKKIHAKCALCTFCDKNIGNSPVVRIQEGDNPEPKFFHQQCFRCNRCNKTHKTNKTCDFVRTSVHKTTLYCVECIPCVFCSMGNTNCTVKNTASRAHSDCYLDAKCKRCDIILLPASIDLEELKTTGRAVHNIPCSGKICPVCLYPIGFLHSRLTENMKKWRSLSSTLTTEHLGFLMHEACGNNVYGYCWCENIVRYNVQRFIHGTSILKNDRRWSPRIHTSFSTEIQEAITTALLLNRYPRSKALQIFAIIPREILYMVFEYVALPFAWRQFNGHILSEICTNYRCARGDAACKLCDEVIRPYPYKTKDTDYCSPALCSIYSFRCRVCGTAYKHRSNMKENNEEENFRGDGHCTVYSCINRPAVFTVPQNTTTAGHYTAYL